MPISPVPIKFQNSLEDLKTYVGIKLKGQNDVVPGSWNVDHQVDRKWENCALSSLHFW